MEIQMAEKRRWLKNMVDGEIYGWNEILAENPRTKEVTEEEAFPEKFIPKKQKGRKSKIDLTVDEFKTKDETPSSVTEEVEEEASKGLPK
tara:strand:- start:275 stop:544 length:270 start_codon:yes stop_codon:yes gene_type:complete